MTAVAGHLLAHDFPDAYKQWSSCDPFILFDAPIHVTVPAANKTIERNLMTEARTANTLMIWTDCDREGENIGWEIISVCRKARPNIVVKRARFSAIIPQYVSIGVYVFRSFIGKDKSIALRSTQWNLMKPKRMQWKHG